MGHKSYGDANQQPTAQVRLLPSMQIFGDPYCLTGGMKWYAQNICNGAKIVQWNM